MSTKYYDKETDTLIPIAGVGNFPCDYGTKEEFETKKNSLPDGTVFTTTDEFVEGHDTGHATTKKYTKTTVANEIYYETAPSDGYFGVTANAQVSTALAVLYILDDSNNRLCGFETVCGTNNYGACNMYVKKGQKVEIKTVNTHGSYTFVPLF